MAPNAMFFVFTETSSETKFSCANKSHAEYLALSPCKPGLTLSGQFLSILNLKILFFFLVEDLSSIKE